MVSVLLVPNEDGTWHMCVDCWAIIKIMVKYRYPIPYLDDMRDKLNGLCIFSKIYFSIGYHQIQMQLGDKWKTTFKTKFVIYKWILMPFGHTKRS